MNEEISYDDVWYYIRKEGFTLLVVNKSTSLLYDKKVVHEWKPANFSHLEAIMVAYASLVEPPVLYD